MKSKMVKISPFCRWGILSPRAECVQGRLSPRRLSPGHIVSGNIVSGAHFLGAKINNFKMDPAGFISSKKYLMGSRYKTNSYLFGLTNPILGSRYNMNIWTTNPIMGSCYKTNSYLFGLTNPILFVCFLACLLAYLPRFLHGRSNCPVMY